jgi:SAM-dependent methyltransferase
MIAQGAETLSMDRPGFSWMTWNPFLLEALLASALALLAWALISGMMRHTWTGGGFNASGPEMPRLREMLALRTGMVLADVGAGKGQLTLALAGAVGPEGHVFSSEIDPARVKALRKATADTRLGNVTVVEATTNESGLPAACCDAIVLRRVYHHLAEPGSFITSLMNALRPGGYLVVIDIPPLFFVPSRSSLGVAPQIVINEVSANGFEMHQLRTDWPGRGPLESYCALFQKPLPKPGKGESCRNRIALPTTPS